MIQYGSLYVHKKDGGCEGQITTRFPSQIFSYTLSQYYIVSNFGRALNLAKRLSVGIGGI